MEVGCERAMRLYLMQALREKPAKDNVDKEN